MLSPRRTTKIPNLKRIPNDLVDSLDDGPLTDFLKKLHKNMVITDYGEDYCFPVCVEYLGFTEDSRKVTIKMYTSKARFNDRHIVIAENVFAKVIVGGKVE